MKKIRDSMAQVLILAMQGNQKSMKILEGINPKTLKEIGLPQKSVKMIE